MEESSFQAIYTGVYIFIFIAALTTTLYMFRNVNELAENAYNYGESVTTQSVITAPVEKTNLTKEDLIAYYFNYIKKDKYNNESGQEENAYTQNITLTINGISQTSINYKNFIARVKSLSGNSFTLKITDFDVEDNKITINIISN